MWYKYIDKFNIIEDRVLNGYGTTKEHLIVAVVYLVATTIITTITYGGYYVGTH